MAATDTDPTPDPADPSRRSATRPAARSRRRPGLPRGSRSRAGCSCSSSSRSSRISTTSKAWPAFRDEGLDASSRRRLGPGQRATSARWRSSYGTLVVALIALVLAVPVSIGIALFVTEVAPDAAAAADRLRDRPARRGPVGRLRPLGPARARAGARRASTSRSRHDVVAAIPVLEDALRGDPIASGLSFMTAGLILAIMITPIITVDHPRGVRDRARRRRRRRRSRSARPAGR